MKDRKPAYVHRFVDRHGTPRLYFRRKGYRAPLPGPLGSSRFLRAYAAALEAPVITPSTRPGGVIAKHNHPLIGVYLLIRKGRIVYVGSSLTMPKRVAEHRTNGRVFDQAFYIATTAKQRETLERILIRELGPAQNRGHRLNGSKTEHELANFDAGLPLSAEKSR